MDTIGVIGAGNIGSSLSHSLILANKKVVLIDISDQILSNAKSIIKKNLRFSHMFLKQKEPFPMSLTDNITFDTSLDRLKECDFIIENITEDYEAKKAVYLQLNDVCNKDAIIAVNTSCISITRIAALTDMKEKILGMHFMNPVYLKDCVEVIRGYHTSDKTIDTALSFLNEIGKHGVVVNDLPGFVSNRISHLFMNEAVFTLQDSVADAKIIDTIFKECFGHHMGPLETADLIGLDTVYNSLIILYNSYKDPKYRPAPLLEKMVNAGLLGVKTKKGFYEYN